MSDLPVFHTERAGDVLLVIPQQDLGGLDAVTVRPQVESLLGQLQQPEAVGVVVDLERVAWFGTSMLEVIHVLWRRVHPRGGKVALCNVSPVGREVLRVSQFDTLWTICATRDEALREVGAAAGMED